LLDEYNYDNLDIYESKSRKKLKKENYNISLSEIVQEYLHLDMDVFV